MRLFMGQSWQPYMIKDLGNDWHGMDMERERFMRKKNMSKMLGLRGGDTTAVRPEKPLPDRYGELVVDSRILEVLV